MMQSQLKISPLTIEHHEFQRIRVDASEDETHQGPISLETVRRVERHPDESRRWMVELTVEFGSSDENNKAPYSGSISVAGWFTVADAYPEERQQMLVEVTAVSILYGACREMVASFTARASHGILSLPSVTFPPIAASTSMSPPAEVVSDGKVRRKVTRKANPNP